VQARYIDFLEGKVSGLTSELETLQAENANLHALIEKLEAPEGQQ
jgi:cell division protein FtsB